MTGDGGDSALDDVTGRVINAIITVPEKEVIVELKTVEELGRAHYAQSRSYLKVAKRSTGLLVNFAGDKADFRRIDS